MSESHDIEQIDEALQKLIGLPIPSILCRHGRDTIATAILPLIASAREEGAREMRERAKNTLHEKSRGIHRSARKAETEGDCDTYSELLEEAVMFAEASSIVSALPLKEGLTDE